MKTCKRCKKQLTKKYNSSFYSPCNCSSKQYRGFVRSSKKQSAYGFKNQMELFEHIWDTRPHISQLTGKPLFPKGHKLWHCQFLHVLSKGTHTRYRLNPDNILLGTYEEHAKQENFIVFNDKKISLLNKYREEHGNN